MHRALPKVMLADDLTGAMDAGVQLCNGGRSVRVIPNIRRCGALPVADWLVIDTGSRNLMPEQSKEAVRIALRAIEGRGILACKKVDSTLRGSIGAELSAILGYDGRSVLFCAALPSGGRTTIDGIHYVNGARLSMNDIARDPFSPVIEDRIVQCIQRQYSGPIVQIDLRQLRAGLTEDDLDRLRGSGARIWAADAENDEDLRKLAELCLREDLLPCGSAGLIGALEGTCGKAAPLPECEGPMLILCGSPMHSCKVQLADAAARKGVRLIRIDPASEQTEHALAEMISALEKGISVAVDCAADGKKRLAEMYTSEQLKRSSAMIQRFLNRAALRAFEKARPSALMILGGDTAAGVLDALEAESIELLGAAQPLIPCGRIHGGAADGCPLITKAGGFGDETAISKSMEAITL